MEFNFNLGDYLDPKKEKSHILFTNRIEIIRMELEKFIKKEWRDKDATNLHVNLSPKSGFCMIGNVHTGPAKIVMGSTKKFGPSIEIVFPMNGIPSIKFLMQVNDAILPVHDLVTGREFGYELKGNQITHYMWSQINRYFETNDIVLNIDGLR